MIPTIFKRFVVFLDAIALLLTAIALGDFLLHPLAQDYVFQSTAFRAVVILVLSPLTIFVGSLIIRRVPGNIVGPLLIAWSGSVAYWSLRDTLSPGLFALFYYYDVAFGWLSLFLLMLHFPDGAIYPHRAAPWTYRFLVIIFLMTGLVFLSTNPLEIPSGMPNPYFLPAVQPYATWILSVSVLLVAPLLVLVLVSQVLRYRNGGLRERQQIKWLALFAGTNAVYIVLGLIAYPLITGGQVMDPGNNTVAMIYFLGTGLLPPATIGIAVLRYRLWDIDLLIRRTLLYSILTLALTVVYFSAVTLLQNLFATASGQQSQIALVLSTLAIAALFSPLRRMIQARIDRRFYRKKVDAEKVLTAFGVSLREQVDPDRLSASILKVIDETMQPAQASVMLCKVGRVSSGDEEEGRRVRRPSVRTP